MDASVVSAPAETLAAIRIFGPNLDFGAISRELGVEPSESHRRGERGPTSRAYPEDMWCLDSPYARKEPLEAHLKWLREVLLPHYDLVRSLARRYELSSYCGISVDGDSCRFELSPGALMIFAELAMDMNLSLVFTGYSESEMPSARSTDLGRSAASFEVAGSGLEGILSTLGFQPAQGGSPGSQLVSGDRRPGDVWSLVAPLPGSEPLDAHVRWLAEALLPRSDLLLSLKGSAELLVRCKFVTGSDTGGLGISPHALGVCTGLETPLEFTTFLVHGMPT